MVSLDDAEGVLAEASVWLARLHNEERTPETEAAFQAWLRAAPAHEEAFDRVTDLWEMLPRAVTLAPNPANDLRRVWTGAAIAAAVVLAVVGGVGWQGRTATYATERGQQQTVTLRDGSRIALNTDSAVAVAFTGGRRRIDLKRGEVLFDVAHDPVHPFVVRAGDEQVRALGTAFVVRRDPDRTTVTLIHGRVGVSREAAGVSQPQAVLTPGQRATIDGNAHFAIDSPPIDTVTAWQRGEAVFADISLGAAAAELNRYGPTRIVITDPAVAQLRVSGVFQTNDASEFAAAMAQLNGLKVKHRGETVELTR